MRQNIKNVVLVHGAFADGSGWEAVANILKNDGYKVPVAQPQKPPTPTTKNIRRRPSTPWTGQWFFCGPQLWRVHHHRGRQSSECCGACLYCCAFALDEGESCASIEQALPQASKAFKPDKSANNNWWIDQEHFAADFAARHSAGEGMVHGYIAGADLHRLVHP